MKRRKLSYWLFVRIPFWFVAGSVALVALLRYVPVRYTPLMAVRAVQHRNEEGFRTIRHWRSLSEISPEMVKAVIASEDNRFDNHRGFDWNEIGAMWSEHFQKGKKLRGCSTISQQTAKNVFTWGTPTLLRKGFEAWWTFLIERIWGKERIMEVYLNVAETGLGLYGAEAAATAYYGIPASRLKRSQAAGIAACLPSPLKMSPDHPTEYTRKRVSKIVSLIPKIAYPDWVDNPSSL